MATQLIRNSLCPLYEAAQDAHPDLLLQRGLIEHDENNQEAKTNHIIKSVCQSTAGEFYKRTYNRWKQATADINRFRRVFLKLETRLFIGLTGGGMLETGCAISHSHGMPYIPGSSIKGVVSAYVRERLGAGGNDICDELFGAPATEDQPAGLSGQITFHDAWWIPGSAHCPVGTGGCNLSPPRVLRYRGCNAGHRLRQSGPECPSCGTGRFSVRARRAARLAGTGRGNAD